jgi:ABC-type transporter Mla MlaB component
MNPELDSRVTVADERESQLALHGTIDVFLARELLDHARRAFAGAGDVRIDCAALERLDTSALQILLALQRELQEQGRRLELRAVNDQVGAFLAFGGAERLLLQAEPEPTTNPVAEGTEPEETASDATVAHVPATAAGIDEGWSDGAPPAEPLSTEPVEALGPGDDE